MDWLERNAGLIVMGVALVGVGLLMLLLLREPTENEIQVLFKEHAALRDDSPRASKITCGYGAIYFERRDGDLWLPAQLEDVRGVVPASGSEAKGVWYVPAGIIRVRVEP